MAGAQRQSAQFNERAIYQKQRVCRPWTCAVQEGSVLYGRDSEGQAVAG
jgi:hypothetical protein